MEMDIRIERMADVARSSIRVKPPDRFSVLFLNFMVAPGVMTVQVRKKGEHISRPRREQKGKKGHVLGTGFHLTCRQGFFTLPENHVDSNLSA